VPPQGKRKKPSEKVYVKREKRSSLYKIKEGTATLTPSRRMSGTFNSDVERKELEG